MIFDFSIQEVMRLSNIKRWGIIEMLKQQSVAEHSFKVAMLSKAVAMEIPIERRPHDFMHNIVFWAMVHDLPELVTGDLPASFKRHIKEEVAQAEAKMFPQMTTFKNHMSDLVKDIVKMCDYVEAIHFADRFCCDTRREEILKEMRGFMAEYVDKMEDRHSINFWKIVRKIAKDSGVIYWEE